MQAIVFMGIQATGKSSFYKERFFRTHVRISLDLLRTRHREKRLLELCLETDQPFVIDNTNPTLEDRTRYIEAAKARRYRVIGYYFQSEIKAALARNSEREGDACIPEPGVLRTYNRLVLPSMSEGFDELYFVALRDGGFEVSEWKEESESNEEEQS